MSEAWNLYLLAFKKMFDYKNTAERKELNWFFLFMFIFWMLSGMFVIVLCITYAFWKNGNNIADIFSYIFIYAGIFFIVHGLPLIALVKRRFNLITPSKSGRFFTGWLSVWLVQLTTCINTFLIIRNSIYNTNNPDLLTVRPLAFLGQICGLVVIGTIIFLMIRKRPVC